MSSKRSSNAQEKVKCFYKISKYDIPKTTINVF